MCVCPTLWRYRCLWSWLCTPVCLYLLLAHQLPHLSICFLRLWLSLPHVFISIVSVCFALSVAIGSVNCVACCTLCGIYVLSSCIGYPLVLVIPLVVNYGMASTTSATTAATTLANSVSMSVSVCLRSVRVCALLCCDVLCV